MRIEVNLAGEDAAAADYDMLKAALVAAQEATPTARAARGEVAGGTMGTAATFADLLATDGAAAALAHRFATEGEAP